MKITSIFCSIRDAAPALPFEKSIADAHRLHRHLYQGGNKGGALVRNLKAFQRFLEVAAICDGEIINCNNIAQDCGVSATTCR